MSKTGKSFDRKGVSVGQRLGEGEHTVTANESGVLFFGVMKTFWN